MEGARRRAHRRAGVGLEGTTRRQTLNELLFPGPTKSFDEAIATYGDVSVLDTADYLYGLQSGTEHVVEIEEGKRLILGLQAISEADERGYRSVMCTINGQLRPVNVRDESVESDVAAAGEGRPQGRQPGRRPLRRRGHPRRSRRATRSRPAPPSPPSRR